MDPSVTIHWYCWLGDRKDIQSLKKLGVGLLVVMIFIIVSDVAAYVKTVSSYWIRLLKASMAEKLQDVALRALPHN